MCNGVMFKNTKPMKFSILTVPFEHTYINFLTAPEIIFLCNPSAFIDLGEGKRYPYKNIWPMEDLCCSRRGWNPSGLIEYGTKERRGKGVSDNINVWYTHIHTHTHDSLCWNLCVCMHMGVFERGLGRLRGMPKAEEAYALSLIWDPGKRLLFPVVPDW